MGRVIRLSISKKVEHLEKWIFAEDLSRDLEASGLGVLPMEEADAVKDMLQIREIKASKLKRCRELVETVIDKHHLRGHVVVQIENQPPR